LKIWSTDDLSETALGKGKRILLGLTTTRGRHGSGVGLCDSFGHRESVTLGLGTGLARAVAKVVVPRLEIWLSGRLGHRLSDSSGSTLELAAGLARAVAEVVDSLCVWGRSRGCCRFDRGDGHKSGVDHGGKLHLECCFVEVIETVCRGV